VRTRADYYYPLFGETVLSLRGRASHILGIAGERVTIGDRFFPGSEVLKGFRLGGFGPRDRLANDALGGNTFYALIQEAQFSLGLPRELGLTGRVWNNVGSSFGLDGVSGPNITNSSALRGATGVGVSWRSPFGPIQIDLSLFPYLKQPSDRTEAIRFSFGTQLN
jgi:outer membrane protein insertion porin family